MFEGPTDIILTTRNRLDYLERTIRFIHCRTTAQYRLHIIDDASDDDRLEYLISLWRAKIISSLLLKNERNGAAAAQNAGTWLAFSNPVVFTDDDVLCPLINPDWLSRGLDMMSRKPHLAMLALHHPGQKHKVLRREPGLTYCKSIGATFLFMRRKFLLDHPLPHRRDGWKLWPQEWRCKTARENGWQIGFLTDVFCYHIGEHSVLTDAPYKGRCIDVTDWKTLKPVRLIDS